MTAVKIVSKLLKFKGFRAVNLWFEGPGKRKTWPWASCLHRHPPDRAVPEGINRIIHMAKNRASGFKTLEAFRPDLPVCPRPQHPCADSMPIPYPVKAGPNPWPTMSSDISALLTNPDIA